MDGWVAEWSIAPSWKGGEPKGSVGSNPIPSAKFKGCKCSLRMIEF